MDSSSYSSVVYPAEAEAEAEAVISPIPVDLFISKKRLTLNLKFNDACGNLVFRVENSTSRDDIVLRDANGNPLIFINRTDGGWEGFRGESRELIFRVEKKRPQSSRRRELEIFLVGDYINRNNNNREEEDSIKSADLIKAIGCPFHRSCTIYRGNSIIAQTSLLYKLRKVIVGRRKFRLTFFPGLVDQALIVALIVIFLD
ncbi:LURP1-like domain [Macleaya cordata]|uniref:LURP1-like domain n=1 Tax=Macleaya cordata TaxID=56857 RepID=A0A200R3E4_MACCD|nr:LURP1-like domain [Macleaya cordata]